MLKTINIVAVLLTVLGRYICRDPSHQALIATIPRVHRMGRNLSGISVSCAILGVIRYAIGNRHKIREFSFRRLKRLFPVARQQNTTNNNNVKTCCCSEIIHPMNSTNTDLDTVTMFPENRSEAGSSCEDDSLSIFSSLDFTSDHHKSALNSSKKSSKRDHHKVEKKTYTRPPSARPRRTCRKQ
ncbi:hypothetical protein FQA39_LY12572 [Lamprigera yunnana]|nr:hypothetical protein FQA39_LY12572 [Lamprigera yunnana]